MINQLKLRSVALLVVMALASGHFLMSQVVTGRVSGVVRDSSGAVVPEAEVTLTSLSTGVERRATTTDQGQYVFPNLQAGDYRLQVTKSGFTTSVVDKLSVQVLQTVTGDIDLKVGASSQETNVTAEAPLINSQTSDLGRVVTSTEIQNLPLNGRNYLQLATLTPGVNTFYSNQTGPVRGTTFFQGPGFLAGTQNVGSSITIGDNREIATSYRIDGVDISNPFVGQSALLPALDVVQEFKVVTGVAPAPLRSPGSVNVMTRGGSNAFHGTAYEFIRNDALDAKSYFDTAKPKLRMNQFGGSIGGPIIKNKTFFFGGYEGFRGRTPSTVRATVPTTAQLAGDFSASATPVTDPSTGTPFADNQIPADRISPFASVLNEFMPAPNFVGSGPLAGLNFETQVTPTYESDQANVRLDHNFSDKDTLFGRYTWTGTTNVSPGIQPLYGLRYPYDSQNAVLTETHSFSPRLLNQFVFGYTRSVLGIEQEGAGGRNLIEEMGISNIAGGEDPTQYGLPTTVIIGYGTFGPGISFSPRGGTLNLYELQDNVSYSVGKHNLQFGIDVTNNRYSTVNPTAPRGFIAFFGNFSGNAVADYLLGLPLLAIADAGNSRQALRWTNFEGYVQDDWRVNSRLTLNLGLRYMYFTAPADQSNGQSYFDFSCPCIVTAASGDIGNGIYRTPKTNFAPRIGLAFDLFGNSKTVLRAGYGIFYFPPVMAENLFLRNNPPAYTLHFITNSTGQPVTSFFPPPLETPAPNTTIFTVDPDAKTSNYQQWSLNVERELSSSMKFTVGYFGSKGTHLQRRINMNQAVPGPEPIADRRPLPEYGDILLQTNSAISNYSALQATILKQFTRGISFWASYEWANGFDDATNEGEAPADRRNLEAEYGRSLYLVPQRFRLTAVYELPFGKGRSFLNNNSVLDKIVGGWQVNTIYTAQHGSPLTITAPATHNTGGFVPSRANQTCDGNLSGGDRELTQYFDTSCFTAPAANTIGNGRRGAIWSSGINNWDLTIAKDTAFAEGKNIRFEAQFFNAFNHPQWNAPITDVSSPSFGRITSSLKGRSIQLGLRLNF